LKFVKTIAVESGVISSGNVKVYRQGNVVNVWFTQENVSAYADDTLFSGLPVPINDRVNYIIDPVTGSGNYYLDRNGRIAATRTLTNITTRASFTYICMF
jgi:hypothetical protein